MEIAEEIILSGGYVESAVLSSHPRYVVATVARFGDACKWYEGYGVGRKLEEASLKSVMECIEKSTEVVPSHLLLQTSFKLRLRRHYEGHRILNTLSSAAGVAKASVFARAFLEAVERLCVLDFLENGVFFDSRNIGGIKIFDISKFKSIHVFCAVSEVVKGEEQGLHFGFGSALNKSKSILKAISELRQTVAISSYLQDEELPSLNFQRGFRTIRELPKPLYVGFQAVMNEKFLVCKVFWDGDSPDYNKFI